jgi:hypothetical protein
MERMKRLNSSDDAALDAVRDMTEPQLAESFDQAVAEMASVPDSDEPHAQPEERPSRDAMCEVIVRWQKLKAEPGWVQHKGGVVHNIKHAAGFRHAK